MPTTRTKTDAKTATPDWMSRIKESSHDVLLAGIGALARARKDGPRLAKGAKSARGAGADFETLVEEGRKLEPEIRDSLQKAWTDVKEKSRTSMSFKPDANLKGVFEQRVAEALARLGVPRAKEIEELNRKVDSLLKQGGTRAKPAPKKAVAKKAVAKKVAAKKAAAKKAPAQKAPTRRAPAKTDAPKKAAARRAPARKAAASATPAAPTAAE